jgi:hypothetical protein
MERAAALYQFLMQRRLVFPLILVAINLASAVQCFAAGDWKRGLYWFSSAVCLLIVAL